MRNSFWLGLLIGSVFPGIAYLLTQYSTVATSLFEGKEIGFYVLAVAINLFLVRLFYRRDTQQDKVAKGIVFVTFIALILFLYTHKIIA
ncbi:hypothetical protein E2P86_17295 [Sphingobacterium psychroaquaticum]|uniref:hypothetical protein n=1 Tax=Sphingobacterium psychroaquaticum TaxID=561061 RepID=UPI00106B425D|nr:hypothetical protein [Sphingobacterium psychroaquaticum]QBQ42800.1 hypothetical protein E2P86_17295 [Sphingobacterium psychroaquaticum]